MAAKKQDGVTPKANKFKFVYIEADLSETNFADLTATISQVMRPTSPVRQLPNGKTQAQVAQGPSSDEDTDDTIEAEFEDVPNDPPSPRPSKTNTQARPKKSKPPEYLHDLVKDSEDLKKFSAEKKPTSKAKQYLTAMYWLKESNSTPNVNIDRIYTFYKTAGWSIGFNDWNQTFHNLLHEDLIRKADAKGEYTINPTGEDVVKSLPE